MGKCLGHFVCARLRDTMARTVLVITWLQGHFSALKEGTLLK